MTAPTRTMEEIREAGLAALARELGPVDMIRFLQQFGVGRGNYTEERHQWLDHLTVHDVVRQVDEQRQNTSGQ